MNKTKKQYEKENIWAALRNFFRKIFKKTAASTNKIRVIKTIPDLQHFVEERKIAQQSIGFVPTMGALHDGHLALVARAVKENDVCIVSVFVNPTQFNNREDLEKYPRNLERDVTLLAATGCKAVFAPAASDIYSKEEMQNPFEFDFGGLDKVMEGRFRPGHFNGVVQIVSKLFSLVRPDTAYFGEKDFQQLTIIHRLNEQMNFGIKIIDCETVRESSGLAMSSRNQRLSANEKIIAAQISKILSKSVTFVPEKSPHSLAEWIKQQIASTGLLQVEYVETVNQETLLPASDWTRPAIVCVAVYCGEVRLIDNIKIKIKHLNIDLPEIPIVRHGKKKKQKKTQSLNDNVD